MSDEQISRSMPIDDGDYSPVRVSRAALTEFTTATNPLELNFAFNPTTITRTRSIEIKSGDGQGNSGGYDFEEAKDVPVVAQGATVKPESFTIKILLDATDRMNSGDEEVAKFGVQPELDILRSMAEPKVQNQDGASTLAALGQGGDDAASGQPCTSLLLFIWGEQQLPVFMTQVQVEVKAYMPNLYPYRAEATLSLQVIESNNPFYRYELTQQFERASNAVGSVQGYTVREGMS